MVVGIDINWAGIVLVIVPIIPVPVIYTQWYGAIVKDTPRPAAVARRGILIDGQFFFAWYFEEK